MVQEINWSADAKLTFQNELIYLEANFSPREVLRFTDRIDHMLNLLRSHPRLGRRVRKKGDIYRVVINKRIVLFYKYKPRKHELLLIVFWNTLQNPLRLTL